MLWHKTYVLQPSKPWIVFIHGAGGSSTIWHPQLRFFRNQCNVLLLDLRGHGKTINKALKSVKSYSFDLLIEDINEVLVHQEISRAHFVGVSLGTILIREFADQFSYKVISATYVGAITQLDFRSRILIRTGHSLKYIIPFLTLYKLFAWIIMPGKAHFEARALFIQQASQISQDEFLRWFDLTHSVSLILSKFNVLHPSIPSLFVMGEKDHLFLGHVKKLPQLNSLAELVVIEDCGHVCNVEKPDHFNENTLAFIKRVHNLLTKSSDRRFSISEPNEALQRDI